jgi:spermidine/putrescine transport system substrate-binding protein
MTIDEAAQQQRARRHRFKPCPSGNPIADMHFHEATGITVRGIAADSDQDMFTKLRAGGGDQYDIVFANAGFCPLYHNAGLTEPLDLNEIPAAKNLWPIFKTNTDFPYVLAPNRAGYRPETW